MEVFKLIVDDKVAVWRRSYITIEANSLEEAVKDCIENGAGNIIDSEYLSETEELLSPDDNHPVTVEVMDTSYNILGTDTKSRQSRKLMDFSNSRYSRDQEV